MNSLAQKQCQLKETGIKWEQSTTLFLHDFNSDVSLCARHALGVCTPKTLGRLSDNTMPNRLLHEKTNTVCRKVVYYYGSC